MYLVTYYFLPKNLFNLFFSPFPTELSRLILRNYNYLRILFKAQLSIS